MKGIHFQVVVKTYDLPAAFCIVYTIMKRIVRQKHCGAVYRQQTERNKNRLQPSVLTQSQWPWLAIAVLEPLPFLKYFLSPSGHILQKVSSTRRNYFNVGIKLPVQSFVCLGCWVMSWHLLMGTRKKAAGWNYTRVCPVFRNSGSLVLILCGYLSSWKNYFGNRSANISYFPHLLG